jgi:hypothetical protein
LPVLWRGGGIMDSAIDDWHSFWGLPRGGRDRVADDAYSVSYDTPSGRRELAGSGWGLGNASLSSKYLLDSDPVGESAYALKVELSLPTAGDGYGHDGVDFVSGLLFSKRLGSWAVYLGTAAVLLSDAEVSGLDFPAAYFEAFSFLEKSLSDRFAVALGVTGSNATVENLSGYPDHYVYLDFQGRYRLSTQLTLEALFRENLSGGDGTTDFDGLIGLIWRR